MSSGTQPLVWVVDSAYTGELHARIGVAERLGYDYELIPLPNGNSEAFRAELRTRYANQCNGSRPPVLVISGTGEDTTEQIADLRLDYQDKLFTVYLASILPDERHPRLAEYDLIASPQLQGDNVVTLTGVPHQLTHDKLLVASRHHADFFNSLPKPIIGLLIGGNTRYCDGFDEHHAQRLALRISAVASNLNACLVVTNSRRTPPNALSVLLQGLAGHPCHFFDWQDVENSFYPALLGHADLFIVTGDSLSMCSEAAFTGKPLLVDLCQKATECYHREIVGRLIDYGAAKLLTTEFAPWAYLPPDPTEAVVQEIRVRLQNELPGFKT